MGGQIPLDGQRAHLGMLRVQFVMSSVCQGLLGRQADRKGSWLLYVAQYFTSLGNTNVHLRGWSSTFI